MRLLDIRALSIAIFCACSAVSYALAAGAAGHWEGAIQLPSASSLPIVVDLEQLRDGAWRGEADIPSQGIRNLAVTKLTVAGRDVSFELPDIPGTPRFQGTLSEDGATISGSFTQSGGNLSFALQRKGDATFGAVPDDGVKLVEAGVPGAGVVGQWHGMLEAGPHKLRVIVDLTAGSDGSLEGTLESVDQGRTKMPVEHAAFVAGDGSVTFHVPSAQAVFEGKRNATGSEIAGQWEQSGQKLPLTLKRAK
jgi:uncharacterized protein